MARIWGNKGDEKAKLILMMKATFFIVFLFSIVVAHVQYRDEIPNGLNIVNTAAVGHVNKKGGGEINAFGKDFKAASYQWTRELCQKDSDGDGQTNGNELGDPCCVWRLGEVPVRAWALSHPGDRESTTTHIANCTETHETFFKFYYDKIPDQKEPGFFEVIGFVLSSLLDSIVHPIDTLFWVLSVFGVGGGPLLRSTRNISTLILTILMAIILYKGTLRDWQKFSWKKNVAIFVLAVFWVDLASGMLHIVLDNPRINHWPIIGAEAQAFQGHHDDPGAITRGKWTDFLREHHGVAMLATATCLFHMQSQSLRVFYIVANILLELMMASHRWSHLLPTHVPGFVLLLQNVGILMSQEHHSRHHVSYDGNFAIFTGWSNPFLNFLTQYVMSYNNPAWVIGLAIWGISPWLLSYRQFNRPILRKLNMDRLFEDKKKAVSIALAEIKSN